MQIIDTVEVFRLLSIKGRLSLELKGMKSSRGSTFAYVKREFNLKGRNQKVYDDYCNLLRERGILKDNV